MAWRLLRDQSLFEPMMFSLMTHICVTLPQLVKRLGDWNEGCGDFARFEFKIGLTNIYCNIHPVISSSMNGVLLLSYLYDESWTKRQTHCRWQISNTFFLLKLDKFWFRFHWHLFPNWVPKWHMSAPVQGNILSNLYKYNSYEIWSLYWNRP